MAGDLTIVARAVRDIGRSADARSTICAALCEITGASFAVLLEPGDDDRLHATGTGGLATAAPATSMAGSIAGHVFTAGEPCFIADVPAHPAADAAQAQHYGTRSALFEPVQRDHRTVAVLVACWTRRVGQVSDRILTVAGLLASEAAYAIERADLLARLERLATTDDLTGLPNRRAIDGDLDELLLEADRGGTPVGVAMLDLDHFKAYNDLHGHLGGDRLLKAAAAAWRGELRGGDRVGRHGGEEFLVLLPGCAGPAACAAADRLRAALPDGVTCSAGVAVWNGRETAVQLIARADTALYAAKDAGRDRTELAGDRADPAAPSAAATIVSPAP
jgi:diguanylate cyclase (GGDEF)-like protein